MLKAVERRRNGEYVDAHVWTFTPDSFLAQLAELRQLGHSSSQVTRDHYIAKPPVSADLSEVLERLAESDDARSDSWAANRLRPINDHSGDPRQNGNCL